MDERSLRSLHKERIISPQVRHPELRTQRVLTTLQESGISPLTEQARLSQDSCCQNSADRHTRTGHWAEGASPSPAHLDATARTRNPRSRLPRQQQRRERARGQDALRRRTAARAAAAPVTPWSGGEHGGAGRRVGAPLLPLGPGFVPGGATRYQKWYPFRVPVPPLRARSHSPASGSAPPEGSARTLTLWSLEQVAIRRP